MLPGGVRAIRIFCRLLGHAAGLALGVALAAALAGCSGAPGSGIDLDPLSHRDVTPKTSGPLTNPPPELRTGTAQ